MMVFSAINIAALQVLFIPWHAPCAWHSIDLTRPHVRVMLTISCESDVLAESSGFRLGLGSTSFSGSSPCEASLQTVWTSQ